MRPTLMACWEDGYKIPQESNDDDYDNNKIPKLNYIILVYLTWLQINLKIKLIGPWFTKIAKICVV